MAPKIRADAIGVDIDKDAVRRVLAKHYRPDNSGSNDPSWLTFIAHSEDIPTIDVIAKLEKELGKPVISSNTAVFWSCLRLLGIKTPVMGYGRLLEQCLDPIDGSIFDVVPPRRLRA